MLLAMFGDEAEALLRSIRARHTRDDDLLGGGVEASRAERIRELVRIVQESGVAEVEIEDAGMRVSVRRHDEPRLALTPASLADDAAESALAPVIAAGPPGVVRVESLMVGTFYRAGALGAAPFVDVGDVVTVGQIACILEVTAS